MHSVPLDDMALFVEVARAGNFSRASARMGLPNATVSRRIAAMERRLEVRLFDRSTRHVALTDAARRYFERCAPLVDEARLAHEALRDDARVASGHLRVSMPVDFGVLYLGSHLPEFARQYPDISLDLDLSPRHSDLLAEPVDVVFRIGSVRGDGLVARRIGLISMGLFASRAYLKYHGRPRLPADLAAHQCLHIGSSKRSARWHFKGPQGSEEVAVHGRIGLNNMSLTRMLAESDLGIALLPVALAQDAVTAGKLVGVLTAYDLPAWPVHAVTASHLQPAAARAFVDFVATCLDTR